MLRWRRDDFAGTWRKFLKLSLTVNLHKGKNKSADFEKFCVGNRVPVQDAEEGILNSQTSGLLNIVKR